MMILLDVDLVGGLLCFTDGCMRNNESENKRVRLSIYEMGDSTHLDRALLVCVQDLWLANVRARQLCYALSLPCCRP